MARFDNGKAVNRTEDMTELERKQKEMLQSLKKEKEEKNEVEVSTPTGAKITTSKFRQQSPLSSRIDNELLECLNDLVSYQKIFERNAKACVNRNVALAIKEYVEKPENVAKIKKIRSLSLE